jgi:glycosyltransferase involved in cell wall biosynthesis
MSQLTEFDGPRPLISVVTPSLNQASFLERAILSVLDQDYPSVEYLVCDGGSTDGSVETLERYGHRLAFWRSGPDAGQAAAVNEGWSRSTGEILGWINCDDFYLPGTFAYVAEFFAGRPDVELLYGTCLVVDALGAACRPPMGERFERARMLHGRQPMPQPATFIRRSLWARIGPLDPSLAYAMDFEYFLRASAATRPEFVERPLAAFTVHAGAKSSRARARLRQETYAVALRYAPPLARPGLWLRAARAAAYHRLPRAFRRRVDRLRSDVIDPA